MTDWIPKDKENIKDLLLEVIDFISEPFMLTTTEGIVKHANSRLLDLVRKSQKEVNGKKYGEVLSCKYFHENNEKCGDSYYCNICEISKHFDLQGNSSSNPSDDDNPIVIREVVMDGTSLTKIFQLHTKNVDIEGDKMILCILKPLNPSELENIS